MATIEPKKLHHLKVHLPSPAGGGMVELDGVGLFCRKLELTAAVGEATIATMEIFVGELDIDAACEAVARIRGEEVSAALLMQYMYDTNGGK